LEEKRVLRVRRRRFSLEEKGVLRVRRRGFSLLGEGRCPRVGKEALLARTDHYLG
jgi:hypothetical protein